MVHHGEVVSLTCHLCGRPLDSHNRHVRYRLPDPVAATPDWERLPDVWMSHGDPNSSVMMQVPGVGLFVRCLLPVHLTGGIHGHLRRLARGVAGGPPARVPRVVGTAVPRSAPRRLPRERLTRLGPPRIPGPRSGNQRRPDALHPESRDGDLARVLTEQWPHEELLAALPV